MSGSDFSSPPSFALVGVVDADVAIVLREIAMELLAMLQLNNFA